MDDNTACCLQKDGFSLLGDVTHASYNSTEQIGRRCLEQFAGRDCKIYLQHLQVFDSAILSLMVSWVRHAQRHRVTVLFLGAPENLDRMVMLGGIDTCLNWEYRHAETEDQGHSQG